MGTYLRNLGVYILLVSYIDAVDRSNFKTCDQSSFCRRLRNVPPGESHYYLNTSDALLTDDSIEAPLINKDAGVVLKFVLIPLIDNTFHFIVKEINPLYPRYEVEGALEHEPQTSLLELLEKNNELISVKVGDNKVILYATPFKVEFYEGNILAAVVNGRGLFKFEHLRSKNVEGDVVKDLDEPPPPKEDPGEWEENFKSHHDSKPRGPEAIGVDVTFPGAHRAYGLPEHGDGFALRSTGIGGTDPYRLYNLDVFEYELESTMAIYGSVPVLYAHGPQRTIGVFWHNAAETWVDISNTKDSNVVSSFVNLVSGQVNEHHVDAHFMSESGVVDFFVFLGPTPQRAVRQYSRLTGYAPLPQYFTLAYHQCRWNYNDEDDVRTVVEKFDENDMPVDVMWLDIEYTDGKKYFTWDSMKFKHPLEMVQNLTATGRKMVVIIDPHIKRESGYFLHEEALSNDYYVKTKDGSVYEGWCWPGSSSYLDFFNPTVRDYYASLYMVDKFEGTTNDVHIWNDMNEPSVFNGPEITMPKDCVHYGGWEHRHVHNIYGLYQTMGTFQGLLMRSGNTRRPFILTRAHFAGTQRYAAVWTGDNAAEWSHLVASLPMCLSEAIAGISFCGADIGGFFNNPDEELLLRWYQAGAWLPFYRAHAHIDTKRREPYLYNYDVRNRIKAALRLRYAHLPFWYTTFWEHSRSGEPIITPLIYEYPSDLNVLDIDNHILIGSSILARPVTQKEASTVSVYFPGGPTEVWYDIEDFRVYPGSGYVNIPVTLDKVPVYYRGGSIIPRKDRPRRSASLTYDDPFTLYVALNVNKTATGSLYIDDYESYQYRNKQFLYIRFDYENDSLFNSFIDEQAKFKTNAWIERVVILGPPLGVTAAEIVSESLGTIKLKTVYDGENNSLTIRKPSVSVQETFVIRLLY